MQKKEKRSNPGKSKSEFGKSKSAIGKSQIGLGFIIFMSLMVLWLLPIALAPFLQMSNSPFSPPIYAAYGSSLVCHQLNSRSLCYFPSNGSIEDCTDDSEHLELVKTPSVVKNNEFGYKFPVCSRDIAIYFSMLLGGIIVFLLGFSNKEDVPNPWYLALAILPMAIDGGTQALGWRESGNFLRLATGFLTGIALPFYFIPMLNGVLGGKRGNE
jgi:uncharacterized membrane protein